MKARHAAIVLAMIVIAVVLVGRSMSSRYFPESTRASLAPAPRASAVPERRDAQPIAPDERAPARAPEPPKEAPSAAPASTKEELLALETDTPPGVIEGIVLRGRDPLTTGGRVYHQKGDGFYERMDERAAESTDPGIGSVSIRPDGTFHIAGLEPATYVLGLELGRGIQNQTTATVDPRKSGKRVVIVLGGARLHGRAWDEHGMPQPGVRVTVANGTRSSSLTGADGSYEIDDLLAGPHWLTVLRDPSKGDSESDIMQRVTFAEGEDKTFDIGSSEPMRTWRGTVRARTGDPVSSGGRIHVIARESKSYSEEPFGADGTFHVALQRGDYLVSVSLDSDRDRRMVLPELSMQGADVERDITVPGTRIRGEVIDETSGSPIRDHPRLLVGVRPSGGTIGGPSVTVDAQGRFAIDAVEPGKWLVSTHPLDLVGGEREIVVLATDVELPLTLTIRTR